MSRALLRAETKVAASPDRLWAVMTDWSRQVEWVPFTRVRATSGAGRGVGGRIEAWSGVGRLGFTDPMVITTWDPPGRFEALHLGTLVRGEGGFEVMAIDPARSRVEWWESFELPLGPVGRLGWRLARPLARLVLNRALDRLRALVEAEADPGRIGVDET